MGGADDDVKIDANRRYVVFTSNGYTIMSRLIEGDFLNYESVIPRTEKHVLPWNVRALSTRSSARRSLLPSV